MLTKRWMKNRKFTAKLIIQTLLKRIVKTIHINTNILTSYLINMKIILCPTVNNIMIMITIVKTINKFSILIYSTTNITNKLYKILLLVVIVVKAMMIIIIIILIFALRIAVNRLMLITTSLWQITIFIIVQVMVLITKTTKTVSCLPTITWNTHSIYRALLFHSSRILAKDIMSILIHRILLIRWIIII